MWSPVDGDRDGRVNPIGNVDGTWIARIGVDDDHDGRPDRWEYYGRDERLQKVDY